MTNNQLPLEHIWSVICNNSSVDQQSNSVSLFNVLEQVAIENKAFDEISNTTDKKGVLILHKFEIVTLWKIKPNQKSLKFEQKLELIDPNKDILDTFTIPLEFEAGKSRLRFKTELPGLKVTVPGDYVFRVSLQSTLKKEWIEVTELPIEVNKLNK